MTTKDLAENEVGLAKITSGCLQTAAGYEEAIRAREEELKVIAEAKKILQVLFPSLMTFFKSQ